METKLYGERARFLHQKLGFDCGFHVDAVGKSGGLVLCWKADWAIEIRNFSRYHIDVVIRRGDSGQWRLSGVYGHPEVSERNHTWTLLRRLSGLNHTWICLGDFNEVLAFSEKRGEHFRPYNQIRRFSEALEDCLLEDLGFSGPEFTWKNGQPGGRFVQERLDRCVANPMWRDWFPRARVYHLNYWGSDHRAIAVELDAKVDWRGSGRKVRMGFRFEPWWMKEKECKEIVAESWRPQQFDGSISSVTRGLRTCASALTKWSRRKFGNIPQRVKRIQGELGELFTGNHTQQDVERVRLLEDKLDKLLINEEAYWQQRSRVDWLKAGDRNTKFFHRKASQRRTKKRIEGIEDAGGLWKSVESDVAGIIEEYFQDIFSSAHLSNEMIEEVTRRVPRCITPDLWEVLENEFSAAEVKAALFEMGCFKAPGPDGFHAAFYQHNWSIVGHEVTNLCLNVLNRGCDISDLNSTHICLIPKIKNPRKVSEFRPISLCNVLYKVITKTIANRLKLILDKLISNSQSAFVPGRLISDNVLVAFELLDTMRKKKKGRHGWMALKLDMSKAYDRVEWRFLAEIMRQMGFSQRWISLIMGCVSSATFSVLINGSPYGNIRPSRGLRQGCPLSPYLFLLCAQGLTSLLKDAESGGKITGLSCSRGGPLISHLLFADDSLIFCRGSSQEGVEIKSLLLKYERASEQLINFAKSAASFSPNVPRDERDMITRMLGLGEIVSHVRYLGLPAFVGRNKQETFHEIRSKVWQKLKAWKGRLFSSGGKEVLIKAVALAIHIYTMGLFRLPASLCDDLHGMVARLWWGGDVERRTLHWQCWDKLCLSKTEGGLGFRDLGIFNQALLAKQSWRLLNNSSSLVARVLKGKYFPNGDLLSAQLGHGPSFIWRSLLWGRELLKRGIRWKVGDGTQIRVFRDPWIPRPHSFCVITKPSSEAEELRVADLLEADEGAWNWREVERALWKVDQELLLRIPIGIFRKEDQLIWHFEENGLYSVKSGYHVGMNVKRQTSSSGSSDIEKWWRKLWNLQIPNKVKIFIWRSWHNILPTGLNLSRRGINGPACCLRCLEVPETLTHALLHCPAASALWDNSAFSQLRHQWLVMPLSDLMSNLANSLPKSDMEVFCMVLWMSWCERNRVVHGERPGDPKVLVERAGFILFEFQAAQRVESVCRETGDPVIRDRKWKPPLEGHLKLNVDASVVPQTSKIGVGGVIRDSNGEVYGSFMQSVEGIYDPTTAELIAIRAGLLFAKEGGLHVKEIESDSSSAVKAVRQGSLAGLDGAIISDIRWLLSQGGSGICQFARRECNSVAHSLAQHSLSVINNVFLLEEVPSFVVDSIVADKACFVSN